MENISNVNEMQTINIDGYDYIGTISIPSLNLNLPVLDTWDYDRLNIGPCLYYGSIYTNNLIICGHSYKKHFKYLGNLKQNDLVIFTDVFDNSYVYEVIEVEILSYTNVDEMINNDFDLLKLIHLFKIKSKYLSSKSLICILSPSNYILALFLLLNK